MYRTHNSVASFNRNCEANHYERKLINRSRTYIGLMLFGTLRQITWCFGLNRNYEEKEDTFIAEIARQQSMISTWAKHSEEHRFKFWWDKFWNAYYTRSSSRLNRNLSVLSKIKTEVSTQVKSRSINVFAVPIISYVLIEEQNYING